MLDDDDGVAGVTQLVQHLQQQSDVVEVQPGGGLVQDVERAARVALAQLQPQLDALRLAAGQRGGALPQADVAQAHVQQGLELARNRRHGAEEAVRVLHRHVQHLVDVAALVEDLQRLAVVALASAGVARHVDVGQEMHLHLQHAVALAGLAATATGRGCHVEAEAARAIPALACGGHLGEQFADGREQARVGGRVAARRAADGALVHVDDLVEGLQALDAVVRRGLHVAAVELAGHGGVERVVDQCALARARHARHTGEQAHRDLHRHVLQVVAARTFDPQDPHVPACSRRAPRRRHLDAQAPAEVGARERGLVSSHLIRRALGHHPATVHARTWAHVHHMIGRADHVLVMLHHQHRVAQIAQALQGADQALVVALVQPDAGLVQHVHHP